MAPDEVPGRPRPGPPPPRPSFSAPIDARYDVPPPWSGAGQEPRSAPVRPPPPSGPARPRNSRWDAPPPSASSGAPAGSVDVPPRTPSLIPRVPPRAPVAPELMKETIRSHYLVTSKSVSGSATIPPHFSLQSSLMELSDAELESSAMHARTEFLEASLVRTQEDAFAYSAVTSATQHA